MSIARHAAAFFRLMMTPGTFPYGCRAKDVIIDPR